MVLTPGYIKVITKAIAKQHIERVFAEVLLLFIELKANELAD